MQVQEQLVKRRCVHISKNGKKRNYSNNHPLSQMVFCGNCHEIFRRVHWNNRGKKSIVWRCVSRLENTGLFCTASTIDGKRYGFLVCIEVFTSEMEYATENGSPALFKLLKEKGHYPYSDLDRNPVV